MSGLGGLNKSPNGVVLGMVQAQLPNVVTPDDLSAQTQRICELVGRARRNMPTMGARSCLYRWNLVRLRCARKDTIRARSCRRWCLKMP